tara:strand:+ start:3607 stop:4710 length:1104 start_codon:yes stop_codon:yes gene_type:complete
MKIKKILQKKFKNLFQFIFHIFYGKVSVITKNDKIELIKKELKKITIDQKDYNINYNIYEIPNARIYTDLVEHVAIIKDNYILPDISYQQINGELKNTSFNKVIKDGTTRIKKKFKGNLLSLVQGASGNNYFHFLFDIIVKIKLVETKYLLNEINYFYIPGKFDWQKKILSTLEIKESQLVDSRRYRHITADKIIALDHPWYNKGKVQDEISNIPDWIIFYLRDKFLKFSKKFDCADKIFIDRSDSNFNHCKLINNQEIIDFLRKNGFESYQTSKLDFFEQIYLFSNAKIIIGPHGAAFSNIIFSKPGLKLIELMPKDHPSIKCEKISNLLKFDYKRIKLDREINDNVNGDIKIQISELNKILESIL